jgi:Lamin Tail Domain
MNRPFTLRIAALACAMPLVFLNCLAAATPNDAVVVFNEIHYNPPNGDLGEYIELSNVMGVNVDLSGWQISNGISFVFPNGTVIAGGATLVVAKTPSLYTGALGPFVGTLSNGGETLRLQDNNQRAMDELTYGDKGAWPVGPDGGGVSLAKKNPASNSADAANWAASAQPIGTPGAANFPGQLAPKTTRLVDRFDSYKYSQASSVAANWNANAFDDSSWTSGATGVQFGNPSIYAAAAAPPGTNVGQWFVKPWTGDSSSEVSAAKTYTHKIGLNRAGTYSAINGVTFVSPGSGVRSGANWSLSGATASFTNNGSGQGANNLPSASGSRQLCEEFFYLGTTVTPRLTLSGLTAGQTYTVAFYSAGFGAATTRQVTIIPSDSGIGYLVDQNFAGSGNGILVKYRYIAPPGGVMNFDFSGSGATNWHHCAFSNELSPTLIPQAEVAATVVAVSSQLQGQYSRGAINCVNGSGLTNGQHATTADNTMWLTTGTFATPNNPLPAEITFDLGASIDLAGFNVWNYNEIGFPTRGANQVVIQTAASESGPFTTATTVNFRIAQAVTTEPGERFDLNLSGVRRVKFIINSSHGGDYNFAGLSEVKFFKQGLYTIPPLLPKEKITPAFNTGETASHGLASVGGGDPHWLNTATGQPAIVMQGNAAWLGSDGLSQWIGSSASGNDSEPAGQLTYRTTFDFTGYDPAKTDVRFYAGADNYLDNVLLNGSNTGISMAGFNSLVGPFTLSGPFNPGLNTADFLWSNAAAGPAALRVKWDIMTQINYGKTALAANPTTTYLRRAFTPTGNATSSYRLLLNYVVDDGAIFYLNGIEIHRTNMPAGAVTSATLASSEVVFPNFNGVIEVPAGAFLPGQANVLAVELHQASAANVDAFFLATLDTVETFAPPSAPSALRFNEIGAATTAANAFFIEVRNTGSISVSLAGCATTIKLTP